jgi:hypothetical protein
VDFQVQFSGGPKGRRQAKAETNAAPPTEQPASATTSRPEPVKEASLDRIPKITRLLVLGLHFEKLVREGVVKDYAEIARLTGLTRARVTQITNLTLLAPSIQEDLLAFLPGREARKILTEHEMRFLTAPLDWEEQQRIWALLWPGNPDSTQP